MGVKGAKNKKQQEKWNKFVSLLIENAGLPSSCLVRLTFMNAEGQKYEINNYQDLKQLSSTYGDKTIHLNYITMHIQIEVLALTFKQYQKRFKYEQDKYMKLHNIKLPQNNILTQQHKQLLSKFVLSPLTTTKAIIQKKIKTKPNVSKSEPPSSSPSIMDMLHVNQPINNKPVKHEETNAVINDLLDNVINPSIAKKQESPSQPPPESEPAASPQVHVQQPVVSESTTTSIINQPKRKLATIYKHSPLISFEEFRYKHYMEKKQWQQSEEEENDDESCVSLPNMKKLMIFNWPSAMNKDTLQTIFSSHGTVINAEVSEQFAIVEYQDSESSKRAIAALNGFQIGQNRLNVTYYILQKPEKGDDDEDEVKEEPKAEQEVDDEEEEEEENRKLVIGNWPQSMGDGLLKTLFSPYGELLNAKIVNECGIIEYATTESADKALAQLNGFQMGANKLVVSFASDQLSHILNMQHNEEESAEEQPEIEPEVEPKEEVDDFEQVGYPVNDEVIDNDDDDEVEAVEEPKKSIFEEIDEVQQDLTVVIKEQQKVEQTPTENEIEEMVAKENDNNLQQILHDDHDNDDEEDDAENGDEMEQQQQLMKENQMRAHSLNVNAAQNVDKKQDNNDKVSHKRSQSEPHKIENVEQDKREESESDEDESSDLSSISSDSDKSESSSDSSSFEEKFKRKYSKKKLSKKQLKRLKKKEKLKRKRKQKRRKNKKLKRREKYVDRNISALNECLEKFTNLMSSVSQSAMVMQQSVAQMSQLHAQQQQQSMIYQQSMRSLFPNQPLYTSIIPTATNPNATQQPGTQTNGGQDISQSMQNVINQMSNTQGGPDTNTSVNNNMNVSNSPIPNNMNTTPKMNVMTQDMLNQQLIQQQQQLLRQQQMIQQQAMQLQQPQQQQKVGQKSSAWVNTNYAKPVLNNNNNKNDNNKNNGIPSSPILHSTHYSPQSSQPSKISSKTSPVFNMLYNGGNAMNLSGDSNNNEPGNNSQSKSKIFEHKKALRNVSPEMEEKLTELNKMGYTNRTFNLVLLKQENGDMNKVIENLKQFYKNN